MKSPRAIIFDVDGTLVDSNDAHARAWQESLAHFGFHFPWAELRRTVGKGADQYLATFLSEEDIARRGKEIVAWRLERFLRVHQPGIRAFPCVRQLLLRIREHGQRIALASSANANEQDPYLRLLDIDDLYEVRTTADDAERSKPHPDIFEAALEKLGVRASDALVVGDTPYDADAAGRAGIPMIGVLCGGFTETELRGAGAREIYKDPEDLILRWQS